MTIPDIFTNYFEPDVYKFFTDAVKDDAEIKIKVTVFENVELLNPQIFILEGLYKLGGFGLLNPTEFFLIEIIEIKKDMEILKISNSSDFYYWRRDFKEGDIYQVFPDAIIRQLRPGQAIPVNPTDKLRRKDSWQTVLDRHLAAISQWWGRLRKQCKMKSSLK